MGYHILDCLATSDRLIRSFSVPLIGHLIMNQLAKQHFEKAKKVLYMSHLALGDYIYQRGYLAQLKQAYPQIQLDVWFDDFRNKKKVFHDSRSDFLSHWISQEQFVQNIYPIANSQKQRDALVAKAKKQQYDIVIFIGTVRSGKFSKYARKIGCNASYCAGVISEKRWRLDELLFTHRLDKVITNQEDDTSTNIRNRYRRQFIQLTGVNFHNRLLELGQDETLLNQVKARLQQWHSQYKTNKVLLVNGISTTSKRDYSWHNLSQVIVNVAQRQPETLIIVNTPPHQYEVILEHVSLLRKTHKLKVLAYTAKEGVGELTALLSLMDGVLSVETAIIHFAAALGVDHVALMRSKTAYWCPLEAKQTLVANKRIDDIKPEQVIQACLTHFFPPNV